MMIELDNIVFYGTLLTYIITNTINTFLLCKCKDEDEETKVLLSCFPLVSLIACFYIVSKILSRFGPIDEDYSGLGTALAVFGGHLMIAFFIINPICMSIIKKRKNKENTDT